VSDWVLANAHRQFQKRATRDEAVKKIIGHFELDTAYLDNIFEKSNEGIVEWLDSPTFTNEGNPSLSCGGNLCN